jgi:hypothetical protein
MSRMPSDRAPRIVNRTPIDRRADRRGEPWIPQPHDRCDFRQMAGVQFAYRSTDTDLATGKLLQTTTILDIRVNPVVDDHLFEML